MGEQSVIPNVLKKHEYYRTDLGVLYHGDCLEILPHLEQVDLVLTEPPYGKKTHSGSRSNAGSGGIHNPINFSPIDQGKYNSLVSTLLGKCPRWVCVFSEWRFIACAESKGLPLVRFGIWHKPSYTPQYTGDRPAMGWEAIAFFHHKGRKRWNGGGTSSVFSYCSDCLGLHPTSKPIALINDLLIKFSNENEVVLDPYFGSGTTGLGCEKNNRRWIGIEIEEKYCEIAVKRIEAERKQLKLF